MSTFKKLNIQSGMNMMNVLVKVLL